MENTRLLTEDEILTLENNGCTAEDWLKVSVAADFTPDYVNGVRFYGEVTLGSFSKSVEVSHGFLRHSGIRNATLRNVTIGDNCLIENIGNYINNYVIGNECIISNVCTMETTDGATFGEGTVISVLNEAGSGNVMLFNGLTANLAALMVRHSHDKEFTTAMRGMVRMDINSTIPDVGTVGNRVKIINTSEITNTNIADECEVNGACRLSDCTLTTGYDNSVYIGSGVICENSIVADGSAVLNSAKINNCYVGECSQITNGFTAENSLFFTNCYMSNGEACAAFCGPFSASHHKSTLLIGGMFSFYNAGSATNFSNHAYKMGPIHYGILERGSKTASGSHILMPAKIGAFSVCLGKIVNHPDTTALPFSYIIGDGRETYIVPARNIATVGLYRDVSKWPRRDVRPMNGRRTAVNYDWLNPQIMDEVAEGLETLNNLVAEQGQDTPYYIYSGCKISRKALLRGIDYYTMAVEMFTAQVIENSDTACTDYAAEDGEGLDGTGKWVDLAGLLIPEVEEERIVKEVKAGLSQCATDVAYRLSSSDCCYKEWLLNYTLGFICRQNGCDSITVDDVLAIKEKGREARSHWLCEIRNDAEKEHSMGDVEQDVLDKFLAQLDEEA